MLFWVAVEADEESEDFMLFLGTLPSWRLPYLPWPWPAAVRRCLCGWPPCLAAAAVSEATLSPLMVPAVFTDAATELEHEEDWCSAAAPCCGGCCGGYPGQ